MPSIWSDSGTTESNYGLTKNETSFSKWRVLTMERLAQVAEIDEDDAVARIALYGLEQLGLDYDRNVSAEEMAQKLKLHRYAA